MRAHSARGQIESGSQEIRKVDDARWGPSKDADAMGVKAIWCVAQQRGVSAEVRERLRKGSKVEEGNGLVGKGESSRRPWRVTRGPSRRAKRAASVRCGCGNLVGRADARRTRASAPVYSSDGDESRLLW